MASEDLIKALSPGIGHQTEEDGTIIQDHAAPTVFSNLMGRLLDQLSTGYSERSKNEENKESVTILDERFVGCNGKKGESAESGVSMAGSDQNESNSIDDQTVEQGTGWLREEAKGCNENEDGVSLLKTENFKNEVRSRRIAMEEEVQRRILDSMVNWFLREEEIVDNENKEEEEEDGDEDEYSLHQEIPLYIQNWPGCKETNVDNEEILDEGFVGCNGKNDEAAESGVSMAGSDQGFKDEDCKLNEAISIDNPIAMEDEVQRRLRDIMVNWFLREEELVDNENKKGEAAESGVSMAGSDQGFKDEDCKLNEAISIDNPIAMEDEVQRRLRDIMVNWFLREEELVDNEKKKGEAAESGVSMAGSDQGFKDEDCKLNEAISIDNPIAMEDEVQRRLRDIMVNWFLREEELVDNENKEEEEEEEDDKYYQHMEILLSLDNENAVSLAETESFKKEEVEEIQESNDLVLENVAVREEGKVDNGNEFEDQRILMHSLVNWFLCKETNFHKEKKEEEEDNDIQHRKILLSLGNWHGCKEDKVDNENAVSLAETESFKKEEVEAIQESNDLVLENVAVREEEKVDNGNEFEDQRILMHSLVNWFLCKETNFHKEKEEEDNDIQHRKILLSLGNWHGCKEEKVDNENEETEGRIATDDYSVEKSDYEEEEEEEDGVSLQRRIPDSIVNCHGCEEEKVDSEKEEEEGREIQINEKVSEDASMLNQITKDLNDIEFALKNENDASAPGMISDAKSEEGAESPESSEMEVTTEIQQENEVK
jgi:hypothetical protein